MKMFINELKMQAQENDNDLFEARIEFNNKVYLVYDHFEIDGIKYYYIIEDISDELMNQEDINNFLESDKKVEMEFIYEVDPKTHMYATVTDPNLLNLLNLEAARRLAEGKK